MTPLIALPKLLGTTLPHPNSQSNNTPTNLQHVYECLCECSAVSVPYHSVVSNPNASSTSKTRIWGTKTALRIGEVRMSGHLYEKLKLRDDSKGNKPFDTTGPPST